MSLKREDVKSGIDKAAAGLKDAIDSIADNTSVARDRLRKKTKQVARQAGDEMIAKGHRLKRAAGGETAAPPERMWPC